MIFGYIIYYIIFFNYNCNSKQYIFQFELIKNKKEAEIRKNFPLELRLKQKIIGQENAINVVSSGCLNNNFF